MKVSNRSKLLVLTILPIAGAILLAACSQTINETEPKDATVNETTSTPTADAETSMSPVTEKPTETPAAGSEPIEKEEPYVILAEHLHIPWSITFDGEIIYINEREGHIVKIEGDQQTRQSVRLTKRVLHEGEGGFLGFLLSPDFTASKNAYAYYTYQENGQTLNRIILLKQEGSEWVEQQTLLEGIPGDKYHNGGRLVIGPDNKLYATTGDAQERALSQELDSLAGKILRMELDGSIPEDNPFPNSYVYSYGHRNPQGIAWTTEGIMYSTEHGPSGNPGGHDEINKIEPGSNYGWPDIIGDEKREGMITPLYHTGNKAIAPSGAAMDDQGRLLFAALMGEALYRYTPATGKLEVLHEGEGRIRDVKLRGNKLYLITNNRDGRGMPTKADDRLVVLSSYQ